MRLPTAEPVLVLALIGFAASCTSSHVTARPADLQPSGPTTALAVDSALATMAGASLWPGFDPLSIPVAMFDGSRTYLFRHPSPPAAYMPLPGRVGVAVREGRDPAVNANSSVTLGGVSTATVMLDTRGTPREQGALTAHELFHVFQRARHPSWQGNEAELFTYPVDDSVALGLRREETSLLARALGAGALDSMRCWARAFVDVRDRRFAAVGPAAAAYERGTELNEGLAQYVERRAGGIPPTLDATDPAAAEVRQRAYAVGAAIAALLDRARPGWRNALEQSPDSATPPLDRLLAGAVGPVVPTLPCAADAAQLARWEAQAGDDVRALAAERARARREYLARPGWRLVVEFPGAPVFPQRFDPLNVARLSPTEILHSRFVRLQGADGSIEVLNASALTEGVPGQHPLFNGVRRVTLTGLAAVPVVRDSAGVLAVDGPGVTVRLAGARADTSGQSIILRAR